MNRESNKHTYIFAAIMVVSVASVLSFTSESLKDLQNSNIKKEKMQNILSWVGINVSRDESESLYGDYVKEELSLKSDGSVDEQVNAFNINLALEIKKDQDDQRFPLYIANVENQKFYVIPLRGAGLWAEIWGYIALKAGRDVWFPRRGDGGTHARADSARRRPAFVGPGQLHNRHGLSMAAPFFAVTFARWNRDGGPRENPQLDQ